MVGREHGRGSAPGMFFCSKCQSHKPVHLHAITKKMANGRQRYICRACAPPVKK